VSTLVEGHTAGVPLYWNGNGLEHMIGGIYEILRFQEAALGTVTSIGVSRQVSDIIIILQP
jgi:hypothetical protein